MGAMERLSSHLKTRLVDLTRARAEGRKIIGYTPGGYLPEELVGSGRVDLSCSITHRLPLEEINHGLEILESREGNPLRIVVMP